MNPYLFCPKSGQGSKPHTSSGEKAFQWVQRASAGICFEQCPISILLSPLPFDCSCNVIFPTAQLQVDLVLVLCPGHYHPLLGSGRVAWLQVAFSPTPCPITSAPSQMKTSFNSQLGMKCWFYCSWFIHLTGIF